MTYSLLTASRMRSFRACRRLHHYKYDRGLRPVREEADALFFGSAIHAALEQWWIAVGESDIDRALDRALDALVLDTEYELARASAMMRAYHERWLHHQDDIEVVSVEAEFVCEVLNPENIFKPTRRIGQSRTWRHAGKIDVLVKIKGDPWIVEHKTTSESISDSTADYWARLEMDQQVSLYYLGAESLGYEVVGCLYDVLRKPALKPSDVPLIDEDGFKVVLDSSGGRVQTQAGKPRQTGDKEKGYVLQKRAETPQEFEARCLESIRKAPNDYLAREPIQRTETQIFEFLWDAWHQGKSMRELRNAARNENGSWDARVVPRNPEACFKWGRRCAFWQVCASGLVPEQNPDMFETQALHPELSGETVAAATGGSDAEDGNTAPAGTGPEHQTA